MIIKTCDNITKLAWITQKVYIRLTRISEELSLARQRGRGRKEDGDGEVKRSFELF